MRASGRGHASLEPTVRPESESKGEQGGKDSDAESEGEEGEPASIKTVNQRPSKEEVARHNVAHLPYRSGCPRCVRGKASRRAHRKKIRREKDGLPVISLDYMWMKGR